MSKNSEEGTPEMQSPLRDGKKSDGATDFDEPPSADTAMSDLAGAYEGMQEKSAVEWMNQFEAKHGELSSEERNAIWAMKEIIDRPVSEQAAQKAYASGAPSGGFAGLDKNPRLDKAVTALQESIFTSWNSRMQDSFASMSKVAKKTANFEIG